MMSLFKPLSGNFNDPFALLMSCHHNVLRFSALLEKVARKIEDDEVGDDVSLAARRVLEYFDTAAPLHHQDEEEDLLPLLSERAFDMQSSMLEKIQSWRERLDTEHHKADQLWQRIRQSLIIIAEGGRATIPEVETFVQLERSHVAFEDGEIFLWASQFLSSEDRLQLGKSMAARRGVKLDSAE